MAKQQWQLPHALRSWDNEAKYDDPSQMGSRKLAETQEDLEKRLENIDEREYQLEKHKKDANKKIAQGEKLISTGKGIMAVSAIGATAAAVVYCTTRDPGTPTAAPADDAVSIQPIDHPINAPTIQPIDHPVDIVTPPTVQPIDHPVDIVTPPNNPPSGDGDWESWCDKTMDTIKEKLGDFFEDSSSWVKEQFGEVQQMQQDSPELFYAMVGFAALLFLGFLAGYLAGKEKVAQGEEQIEAANQALGNVARIRGEVGDKLDEVKNHMLVSSHRGPGY